MTTLTLTATAESDTVPFMAAKNLIFGIDPGFTGALAVIDFTAKKPTLIDCIDMPLKTAGQKAFGSASQRRHIDLALLTTFILSHSSKTALAVVERVSAAPGQGVTSMFRFGEGFGMIQGILAANGIREQQVMPSVWKPNLGLSTNKAESIKLVADIFGQDVRAKFLPYQRHHGRAEAILLAHYGCKMLKGILKGGDDCGDIL